MPVKLTDAEIAKQSINVEVERQTFERQLALHARNEAEEAVRKFRKKAQQLRTSSFSALGLAVFVFGVWALLGDGLWLSFSITFGLLGAMAFFGSLNYLKAARELSDHQKECEKYLTPPLN